MNLGKALNIISCILLSMSAGFIIAQLILPPLRKGYRYVAVYEIGDGYSYDGEEIYYDENLCLTANQRLAAEGFYVTVLPYPRKCKKIWVEK